MTATPSTPALQFPDWEALFQDRILPTLGVDAGGVDAPQWIFVCGQPGAGKSTLIRQLADALGADRTQVLSTDALCALLPELYLDRTDPGPQPLREAFAGRVEQAWLDALIDRAARLGAHVIWERPKPGIMIELAILARAMGYRVDCRVLAVPLLDSWLATLLRETAASRSPGHIARRVPWTDLCQTYARWPAFLAEAEDRVAFDSLQIVGRDGQALFQNEAVQTGATRRWRDPAFGAESLLVERLAPRPPGAVEALIAAWEDLRVRPDIAFRNHEPWPHADIVALGAALQALATDPAAQFDLSRATESPDPLAAQAWRARLQAEIAASLALPDAPATFSPRADRLLALVDRMLQPTR